MEFNSAFKELNDFFYFSKRKETLDNCRSYYIQGNTNWKSNWKAPKFEIMPVSSVGFWEYIIGESMYMFMSTNLKTICVIMGVL
jgi:hypothetical protein